MDRKSILVLVASFAVLLLWFWVVPILYPPVPKPPASQTNVVGALTNQAALSNAVAPLTSAPPALVAAATNGIPQALVAPPAGPDAPEQIETIETPEAVFTFTSRGGGLKSVELKKYTEEVGRGSPRGRDGKHLVELNARAETPILALRGGGVFGADGACKLTRSSPRAIQIEQALSGGLVVVKEFIVGSNYLLQARVRIENRGSQAASLPEHSWSVGTASSVSPLDDPTVMGAFWYNGQKREPVAPSWFENRSFCMAGVPRLLYSAGDGNVQWVAVHNQFFAVAALTSSNQPASKVLVRRLDLPQLPTPRGKSAPPFGYEASLAYPAASLPAGQILERQFTLYAGPKEYKTLSRLGGNLDGIMGYDDFFGWFAKALLLSMNGLFTFIPNYGIVIILITVIIKLLFWPLTQASTRSMKRMQALQPQMKALQEKYKDDPAKMNKKLMEFMKENKVSPLGGCLPMLLQMPVFIGFFYMIRSAIELRGAAFLWARDLSRPDTLFHIPGLDWIPFFGQAGLGLPINPLPLLMGATMLWQARMTPVTPGMDPMQQKIMKYMPMMFMVFLYNFSAGLTLYWTVQNLLTIAQMKLTKTQTDPAPAAPVSPAARPPKKKKQV